ncbi:MAG: alpha/beta hydrolase [Bryobacteraceae bacterium]|nr:alpha/beta hydrolase [Bryobacteraceae bacterium]
MKVLILGMTILLAGTPVRAFGPISVTRLGQGPPVIFLPCLGCAADIWRETAEELAITRECILVSIPGFGSPASPGGFDPARVRAAVADLARNHPELFSRIVIVDSYPRAAALPNPAVIAERAEKDAEMSGRLREFLNR